MAGTISLSCPQHKQREHLWEVELHRHLLANLIAGFHAHKFLWGLAHSKSPSTVVTVHHAHPTCHTQPCIPSHPQALGSTVPSQHCAMNSGSQPQPSWGTVPSHNSVSGIWERTSGQCKFCYHCCPIHKFPSRHTPQSWPAWVSLTSQKASTAQKRNRVSADNSTERKSGIDTTGYKQHT